MTPDPPRAPSISDGNGLAIVVNAAAGSARSDDDSGNLATVLPGAELIEVTDEQPIATALDRAVAATVVGIVGGDGSINAAAERALAATRPLAVFPGGTLNHFARDLGIGETADTIRALRAGQVTEVDVGVIDGRPFLNTASFGSYAEFVDKRERRERRLGKWTAAVLAAVEVLWNAEPLRVELDGRPRRIWMIFVGNCEYEPAGAAPASRKHLDDGVFDVRYVEGSARWSRTRFVGALITGRLAQSGVYFRSVVRTLDVHSLDGPLRLAHDGETFDGGVDIRIEKHPERLAVYAPRPGAGA